MNALEGQDVIARDLIGRLGASIRDMEMAGTIEDNGRRRALETHAASRFWNTVGMNTLDRLQSVRRIPGEG